MNYTRQFPTPSVGKAVPKLRVLGTAVTQSDVIKLAAEKDLDIKLDFICLDGTEAQRRGALAPHSFDIYDQWFHDLDLVWPSGSLRGIDIERIGAWHNINDLPKTGRLSPSKPNIPGGDPSKRLYVQLDKSLGDSPTDQISMLPTVHNADGFAAIGNTASSLTSWCDLLDPNRSGKVILQRDAAIGILEILLALISSEKISITDPGNLSLEEIDTLICLMNRYIERGQFRCIWADEAEAVTAVKTEHDLIGSLWWSGAMKLRRSGLDVRIIEPKEGCRGWYGGMSLSSRLEGRDLDAAYEYLNWWIDGYAGAVMARQGSYISNPMATKNHLSEHEWDFWYDGKPASAPIRDHEGQIIYEIGDRRSGSYAERMEKIILWNTVMTEHNYLVRKWENALRKA